MSCDICGKNNCERAFHSVQMQQARDDAINSDKSNLLSEIAALRKELSEAEAERDKLVAAFAHLQSFVSGDLQEYDAAEVASLINAALKEEGK